MIVESVWLKNFRNFEKLELKLDKDVNIFVGNNAQGKTNFLEAIYLCSTGHSWRTRLDRELIKFREDEAHIRVTVENRGLNKVDVHLKKDGKFFAKYVAINGVSIKKLDQLFGNLLTVVFSPEDLQLIKAGPTERRRFMDMELCQLSAVYFHELQQYYHVLKQRNRLLKNLKQNRDVDVLDVWDEQLVKHGAKIMKLRAEFIESLDGLAREVYGRLTDGRESLKIVYRPNVSEDEFRAKLKKNIERDIILGATSAGIHKDDLTFLIDTRVVGREAVKTGEVAEAREARVFGSQGQQRTVALSVKLAEIKLIQERTGNDPVLLLDDVLSELDESRQKFFLNNMSGVQTIITCTGLTIEKGTVYRVTDGSVSR